MDASRARSGLQVQVVDQVDGQRPVTARQTEQVVALKSADESPIDYLVEFSGQVTRTNFERGGLEADDDVGADFVRGTISSAVDRMAGTGTVTITNNGGGTLQVWVPGDGSIDPPDPTTTLAPGETATFEAGAGGGGGLGGNALLIGIILLVAAGAVALRGRGSNRRTSA